MNSTAHLEMCQNRNASVTCGVHAVAVNIQMSVRAAGRVIIVSISGSSIRVNQVKCGMHGTAVTKQMSADMPKGTQVVVRNALVSFTKVQRISM